MPKINALVFSAVLVAALSLPAVAHHGWSEYDSSKELKLTGTIADTRMDTSNW
jgi:hypothetical protein